MEARLSARHAINSLYIQPVTNDRVSAFNARQFIMYGSMMSVFIPTLAPAAVWQIF